MEPTSSLLEDVPVVSVHRADGSPKVHLDPCCNAVKGLRTTPVRLDLPLVGVSRSGTCLGCALPLLEEARAWREVGEVGADPTLLVSVRHADVEVTPPALRAALGAHPPAGEALVGTSRACVRVVPTRLARWAALYSRTCSSATDRDRLWHHPVGPGVDLVILAGLVVRVWRTGALLGDDTQHFQYALPVAVALLGLSSHPDLATTAVQLWEESARSDGALVDLGDALHAARLLLGEPGP